MPEIVSLQSELPLRVPVCAWCKPKNRSEDLGPLGSISHGICPRHLKKFMLEMQLKKNGIPGAGVMVVRRRRRAATALHPELTYLA